MKRVTRVVPLILAVALAATAFGVDDVTNSPHNLNNYHSIDVSTDRGSAQVCLPCHVPHNAYPDPSATDPIDEVLWNHSDTQVTFAMYLTLSGQQGDQPEGTSKMCLSCHDGVTAVDSYGGVSGSVIIDPPFGIGDGDGGTLQGDLTDDHPIGIVYPLGNPGYRDPSGFGTDSVKLVTVNGEENRVECVSCHNPHDLDAPTGAFLRETLNQSTICLKCHIK